MATTDHTSLGFAELVYQRLSVFPQAAQVRLTSAHRKIELKHSASIGMVR